MKQEKENKAGVKSKVEQQDIKDPREFIYPQGVKVEIDGYVITDLIMIFEQLLKDEIKVDSKFKYNYLNEKGTVVKNVKQADVDSGKLKKVVDFKRTILEPSMDYTITEKGIAYAELKNFLEAIHFENVQKGNAINYKDLPQNLMVEPNS